MKLNKRYIDALIKRYEADILEAECGLELYLSKSQQVAIGEHSDLLIEIDKFVDKLTNASDKLDRFNKFIEEKNNE